MFSSVLYLHQVMDSMPLGVINVADTEASFEAMDFLKHEDVLK